MVLSEFLEIYKQRTIVWAFAITDLKLRYKNSILGFFWSFLEPLLMLAVLYYVFTFIFPSKIEHYSLYLLLGIIIWNSFSRGTNIGMNSILARAGLISTVFFPRFILPISATITSFIMMGFELGVFSVFMAVFQLTPQSTILIFPLLIGFLFLLNAGISLPLSRLNVKYKDITYIWQVIIQAGFFVSPIIYSLEIFPTDIQRLLLLNPVAQIIDMSHKVVLYGIVPEIDSFLYTGTFCVVVFIVGFIMFQKKSKNIADDL